MIAKTPPMGWNSWDCYGAAVTEDIVRANAEFMAKNLRRFGWEYVVVDIQWYEPTADTHEYHPFAELCMDVYSRLLPAENRFPSAAGGKGFAPLAEYIHSLGLKFGIHIMRGIPRQAVHRNAAIKGSDKRACDIAKGSDVCMWNTDMYGVDASKPGAKEYYDSLFELYASWGVDFVKCDDIARELDHAEDELLLISEAAKNCGRDIVLSLSPGPAPLEKAELFKKTVNMWRMTDDFWDSWPSLYNMFERCDKWARHNGAGHWADADMLPLGAVRQVYGEENFTRFNQEEQMTMMTLWSIFRSPMMMGGDLTKCDKFTFGLLTNAGILEMLSRSRGARQIYRGEIDGKEAVIWTAYRAGGGAYIALFNLSDEKSRIAVSFEDCEVEDGDYQITGLWSGFSSRSAEGVGANVPPHGAAAFRIEKIQ